MTGGIAKSIPNGVAGMDCATSGDEERGQRQSAATDEGCNELAAQASE